jgi:hypothetical protein
MCPNTSEDLLRCRLCGAGEPRRNSHIAPKFVLRWLKRTSITGRVRSVANPNLIVQDLPRARLLCAECENRFSNWEGKFKKNLFDPHHSGIISKFRYDDWLLKFAVSLSWRVCEWQRDSMKALTPHLLPTIYGATTQWLRFLLGEANNPGPYEHHIFFLDRATRICAPQVPALTDWYLARFIDFTAAYTDAGNLYVYSKLARIILCAFIRPPFAEGWKGTKIEQTGTISNSNQTLDDSRLLPFIFDRAAIATEARNRMSGRQLAAIAHRIQAAGRQR